MKINFYYPSSDFPSLSVTGSYCSLKCRHCNHHYLEHMSPVLTEEALYSKAREIVNSGGTGFLISGGSDFRGKLPIYKFKDTLKRIKKEFGLIINAHTGLLEKEDVETLVEAEIDNVSFDLVGSDKIIKEIFNLDKTVQNYENSLMYLDQYGLSYTPHIIIGLDWGKVNSEYKALDFLTTLKNFKKLIFLILIPTRGTEMALSKVPEESDIIELFKYSIQQLSKPHVLGCMRPRHMISIEKAAMDMGFEGIVIPSKTAIEYANNKNYVITNHKYCCSL